MKRRFKLLLFMSSMAFAIDRAETVYGPYKSNIGEVEIQVRHQSEGPNLVLYVLLKQADSGGKPWIVIHQRQVNRVEYVAPLAPDETSFLVVLSGGSGVETLIFQMQAPRSVVTQLEAIGKDFPEIVRAGVEDTQFVIVRNASQKGNVLDVVDIYALQDGVYKRKERISYEQKLGAIVRLSRAIDQTAAKRRRGVVGHP